MDLIEAFNQLQSQELIHKFIEIGKVLLTWAILKNVDMVRNFSKSKPYHNTRKIIVSIYKFIT
jgi:hypothetical protein